MVNQKLFRSENSLDPLVEAAKNIGQYIIEEVRDHRFVTDERKILKNVILNIK